MRAIRKEREPPELTQYRALPDAVYDGPNFTKVKERIRQTLLMEQGGLCAYCMSRIKAGDMKIEHWHSQSRHSTEQLRYRNLLACCMGNEGEPKDKQHCDTHKGEDDISFNPTDPADHPRLRIRYLGDGTIRSDDGQFNDEINQILNLNHKKGQTRSRLENNRASVYNSVVEGLSKRAGSRSRREVQKLLDKWNRRDEEGRLKEFCGVAVYYLEKRLKKAK